MRALKLVFGVICLSLMLGISGQAQLGGGNQDTFNLKICNSYGKPILLSLVHRVAPQDQRFVVKGWFVLENGCAEGELPRGNFGTFAFAPAGDKIEQIWAGDIPICVVATKNFERVLTDNYRCRRENQEVIVRFQGWRVTDEPEIAIEFK